MIVTTVADGVLLSALYLRTGGSFSVSSLQNSLNFNKLHSPFTTNAMIKGKRSYDTWADPVRGDVWHVQERGIDFEITLHIEPNCNEIEMREGKGCQEKVYLTCECRTFHEFGDCQHIRNLLSPYIKGDTDSDIARMKAVSYLRSS